MSAYIVDPRTIDYLVQWASRHTGPGCVGPRTEILWSSFEDVPDEWEHAVEGNERWGYRLVLSRLHRDTVGTILMQENIRSVRARYPDNSADQLPGAVNQSRVFNYEFRHVDAELDPAWVVKSCDCLTYQSCETGEYEGTLAGKVSDAIRESAIRALVSDAPWGVSEDDLQDAHPVAS